MLRAPRKLLLPLAPLLALGALALASPVAGAAEAPAYNMQGTWTTGYRSGGVRAEENGSWNITSMNMTTGAFSGTAVVAGEHFTLQGVESGASVHQVLALTEGVYEAHDEYTLSTLASGHVGTNNGTFESGQFWAEQTSNTTTTPAEEAAKKAKEAAEKEKRPTGTSVICNYEFATSQNTCVASVGDGGSGTPLTPTGTVTFTTTSGGFTSGASCSVGPTPGSPSVASCSLVYFTTSSGLPSITATYGGDSHHAGSSGHTQFLGMGTEGTLEAPAGAPGQYPNEIGVSSEVPIAGTTVEGSAQGAQTDPLPAPIVLPGVSPTLDSSSADDLRVAEALLTEVDVEGAQNPAKVSELDHSMEKLDDRALELTKSASAAEQAEGQKLLKDATEAGESLTKMLKVEGEYAKDAIEGSRLAGQADQSIEKLDEHAVELLKSTNPADQLKAQALLNEANQTLEALLKAAKQKGEIIKKVVGNASAASAAASASRLKLGRIKVRRVPALADVTMRNVAAGKVRLVLHLNRAALRKLAGKRSSVTVTVRVNMVLPSALYKGGVTRSFVEHLTLRKASARRRK